MNDLLLHPQTRRDIERLLQRPSQSLLITGKAGSGTSFTSECIAKTLLDVTTLENQPYFLRINDADASIGIEAIRELQQFLKLKVTGDKKGINRVVVIEKANRMSTEAQNALLKTLEEPPAGSALILTAQSTEEMLPTIVSRTQVLQILPLSPIDAFDHFKAQGVTEGDFRRAYALSGGGAGLLIALIEGGKNDLLDAVALAKEILSEPIGKRLLRTDDLAKDKTNVPLLLDGLFRICHAGLQAAALKNTHKAVGQWQSREKYVLETMSMHKKNANTKLMLDALFMSI